ncbi:class I SAM-dependent methyltransferase [Primorskyibacter flagellatus]|nr:class I SAM-dependent methyltransferase [Primorskyibacter flagellatus]
MPPVFFMAAAGAAKRGTDMPDVDAALNTHYTTGHLREAFLAGIRASGADPDALRHEDIENGDEFHTGGGRATDDLLAQVPLARGMRVVDIGCGVGGPARKLAFHHGCHVTGIDPTEEFIDLARELSSRTGLSDLTEFVVGSGTDLPLADGSQDLALLLHVGMNIPDKPALMAEAFRVLKPGGHFAIFDVMRGGGSGSPGYPLPWSSVPETSFLEPLTAYRDMAEAAGFTLHASRDRSDFALDFTARMKAQLAESGPPPLGPHVMMGAGAPVRMANFNAAIAAGQTAPTELILRKP